MEVVRYEVHFWGDDTTIHTEKGWTYGETVSNAVDQIMNYYGADNVDTITIHRLEEREYPILPDWELEDVITAEQNDTKN